MKITNINNQKTFNGYKNLGSHTEFIDNKNKITYITMELTNENKDDLNDWINIQKKIYPLEIPSNIITIHNLDTKFLNNKVLVNTFEVDLSMAKNREEERFLLKIYEFLESLSYRISNDENIKEDINIYKVYKQLSKTLKKIYPPDLVKAFLIYTPMQ